MGVQHAPCCAQLEMLINTRFSQDKVTMPVACPQGDSYLHIMNDAHPRLCNMVSDPRIELGFRRVFPPRSWLM